MENVKKSTKEQFIQNMITLLNRKKARALNKQKKKDIDADGYTISITIKQNKRLNRIKNKGVR